MNKKAQTLDNMMVMVKFFAFALFLLVAWVMWNAFTTTEMDEQIWEQSSIGVSIRNNANRAFVNWDWVAVIVYFSLHIGVIVLAFLLRTHPIVYVAGILIIVIMMMIAAPLANAWDSVSTDSGLTAATDRLPKVDFIMRNFPTFELIWGILTLIVFAGIAKSEGLY